MKLNASNLVANRRLREVSDDLTAQLQETGPVFSLFFITEGDEPMVFFKSNVHRDYEQQLIEALKLYIQKYEKKPN